MAVRDAYEELRLVREKRLSSQIAVEVAPGPGNNRVSNMACERWRKHNFCYSAASLLLEASLPMQRWAAKRVVW